MWRALGMLALAGCAASDGSADGGDDAPSQRPPSGPVTLAVAGDAMLGRAFNGLLAEDPEYAIWRQTAPRLEGVDVLAFNLETTITDHDEKWEGKNWNFKLDPALSSAALGAVVRDNGVPAAFAATANNHALDFHVPGMLDTLENLDAAGMPHAGSGPDIERAREPAIVETVGGVTVAFLAASTVCSCGALSRWSAGPQTPGAWMIGAGDDDGWDEAVDAVVAARANADYVVFSLHWGVNYVETWPVDWMRQRAEQLIDAGVDVIYGHSAHHVLPVERIGNGVVVYGTGDFIDDYSGVDGFRNDLSIIAVVGLAPDAVPVIDAVPLRLVHDPDHYATPLATAEPDYDTVWRATGLP